jgi:hypothetical protein
MSEIDTDVLRSFLIWIGCDMAFRAGWEYSGRVLWMSDGRSLTLFGEPGKTTNERSRRRAREGVDLEPSPASVHSEIAGR